MGLTVVRGENVSSMSLFPGLDYSLPLYPGVTQRVTLGYSLLGVSLPLSE